MAQWIQAEIKILHVYAASNFWGSEEDIIFNCFKYQHFLKNWEQLKWLIDVNTNSKGTLKINLRHQANKFDKQIVQVHTKFMIHDIWKQRRNYNQLV